MDASKDLRIGLFGGSFDPIHNGHIVIAREAATQFQLDRVLFIPAALSPLKDGPPQASDGDRAEMINKAIESEPGFELSRIEIERGGISYSYETVAAIQEERPGAKLFWILGGDQARQLDQWRHFQELAQKVDFICLRRDSGERADSQIPEARIHELEIPPMDISSTKVREALRSKSQSNPFLPDPVFQYIKARNLYADTTEPMTEDSKLSPEDQRALEVCCQALDETKGEDIVILDVSEQSSITNYLILASANSQPHLRALKRDLDKALKDENVRVLGVDEGDHSGWSVVDAFDVMIHLFTPEMRANYDLESLWKDARPIALDAFLSRAERAS